MSIIDDSNPRYELLKLPNHFCIKIDYGVMDDGSWSGKKQYLEYFAQRLSGSYRRSRLFNEYDELITEVIEKNPDYLSEEEEKKLEQKGLTRGDETGKLIKFDNGMVAKVEYWDTPEKQAKGPARSSAYYRRIILFDENNEIISEIMEENPYYKDPNIPVIDIFNEEDDFLD